MRANVFVRQAAGLGKICSDIFRIFLQTFLCEKGVNGCKMKFKGIEVFTDNGKNAAIDNLNAADGRYSFDDKNMYGYLENKDGIVSFNCKIKLVPYTYVESFAAFDGICIELEVENVRKFVANRLCSPFWSEPCYGENLSELPNDIQGLLVSHGDSYTFILPIAGKEFICRLKGGDNSVRLCISKGAGGYVEAGGACAVVSKNDNPYEAVAEAYKKAIVADLIYAKGKSDKQYPQMFEFLGWCSWNALYHEVSEDSLMVKAEEFSNKNIPVKWFMIDDGWSPINFEMRNGEKVPVTISDIVEDMTKFPNGLSETVKKLKNKGVSNVGVWHSLTGYWYGIDKSSELAKQLGDCIIKTNAGCYIPNPKTCNEYFDKLYKYLKESGIDFLKIDTQGNVWEFLKYMPNACEMAAEMHRGFSGKVSEYFDKCAVSCMSMSALSFQNTEDIAVMRSSDDFYPLKQESFVRHIMQNAYNSVFISDLYYCDFDMWWSNHIHSVQSGMLRAISGGPIYISDKIGDSQRESIMPLIEEDGRILRCDNVGKVTVDCLFKNPVKTDGVLKIFNTSGDCGVIAVFNLSDRSVEVTVSADDFYGSGKYTAYVYTRKQFISNSKIKIELPAGKSEIVNFYKIIDGYILVGDLSKYVSVASSKKQRIPAEEVRNRIC